MKYVSIVTSMAAMATLCLVARTARAEPDAPPRPLEIGESAKISLDVQPIAPVVPRTFHMHDGFYLRMSVGFGSYRSSFNDSRVSNINYDASGGSMAYDLLIGGSPSPGVSIGGALLFEPLFSGSYHRNGVGAGDHGAVSSIIGPFIDGFPDAKRGFHLGGMLGLASESFTNLNDGSQSTRSAGIGGATWFGYDFWVGDEWSMGPELRLMGMRTTHSSSNSDIAAWARSLTVCFTALYN